MPITSKIEPSKDLTHFTGTGNITFQEVTEAIETFYNGDHTLNVLWDLREATAGSITSEQVDQIATLLQRLGGVRKGVRTAIVTPVNINFGLARMLVTLLETKEENLPVGMSVFRAMEEAMTWLYERRE
jgi:hypothetical protein